MRGEILNYDTSSQTGLISGDDSLRYTFSHSDLQGTGDLTPGTRVDFVPQGDQATQVVVLAAIPASATATPYGQAGHAPVPDEASYDWKSALLSFNGRLRRQHFWISWLVLLGAGIVVSFIPILGILLSFALIWPNLAIQVKRLHDMGKSGWLVLVPVVGTLIGTVMIFASVGTAVFTNPEMFENNPAAAMSMVGGMLGGLSIMMLIGIAFLLWIGVSDSQRGDNKYGPNPKGL